MIANFSNRYTKNQISVALSFALFIVYACPVLANVVTGQLIFIPLPSADTVPAALLPVSLLRNGNLYLDEYSAFFRDNYGAGSYFVRLAQGHIVSNYPIVAAVMAVPVYVLPVWAGWVNQPVNCFYAARIAAAMLTALAMGIFLLTCLEWLTLWKAIALTLALGLGTSIWTTASQALWQHTASLPLLCCALLFLVRGQQDDRLVPWSGFLLSAATVARYNNVTTFAALALFVLYRHRRRLPAFGALAMLPILALLVYNYFVFGYPFELSYGAAVTSGWTETWWRGFAGLLVSPAKGLFVFSPFLLLAFIGSVRSFWQPGSLHFHLVLAVWCFVLVMSFWWGWYGGWSYGNRMLTDSLPLWGLILIPICDKLSGRGWLLFGMATLFAVGVQSLGLFDYGVNWHILYDKGTTSELWLWDVKHSPILFYAYHYAHRLLAFLQG